MNLFKLRMSRKHIAETVRIKLMFRLQSKSQINSRVTLDSRAFGTSESLEMKELNPLLIGVYCGVNLTSSIFYNIATKRPAF